LNRHGNLVQPKQLNNTAANIPQKFACSST